MQGKTHVADEPILADPYVLTNFNVRAHVSWHSWTSQLVVQSKVCVPCLGLLDQIFSGLRLEDVEITCWSVLQAAIKQPWFSPWTRHGAGTGGRASRRLTAICLELSTILEYPDPEDSGRALVKLWNVVKCCETLWSSTKLTGVVHMVCIVLCRWLSSPPSIVSRCI